MTTDRVQLLVFEQCPWGLTARCLLCGAEGDPIANATWHGRHLRTDHPEYVNWICMQGTNQ